MFSLGMAVCYIAFPVDLLIIIAAMSGLIQEGSKREKRIVRPDKPALLPWYGLSSNASETNLVEEVIHPYRIIHRHRARRVTGFLHAAR